uniref:Core domain-containing protein n=1 Tax=Timspurckia oligopyrenoides TaxID=708627 RepID=A0A7S0ZM13_9RHOD|mmetsp:Transcript_9779/g.17621  ORF Transcript_9779/g.17621 Transcript_9779/m.17621 type:complete len:131 (+) Transcript_9779:157-549(+)|eukprot:CAMPEP_0182446050 /NCGR_PEP_ID=MMETSP1172-20130603/3955_1 /TAXON_ID=708627 /ORGANISM="Timspurckia oligopyrenoides, Strain CCMP3278" /LENGTH=130 /DNA_ID=CAMNT_0024641915 /DNA_START=87 /DNA_END=479 /DNA_ORIENTATION=+
MSHAGRVVAQRVPRIRKAAFELTERAAQRIQDLMANRTPHPVGVRVSLKHRGCNGMSYTLNYVNEDSEAEKFNRDEKVTDKGVTVYVDSRALLNIAGTQMDFVDTDLASEFVFQNPNAKGTCGCGESFST